MFGYVATQSTTSTTKCTIGTVDFIKSDVEEILSDIHNLLSHISITPKDDTSTEDTKSIVITKIQNIQKVQ